MANPTIRRITNCNVYLNGTNSLLGAAEEVELPQPKTIMVEHKGLGLWDKAKLPAGGDFLEAKIKWTSLYPEVLGAAFLPTTIARLMVRANQQEFGAGGVLLGEVPVVALINGIFSEMPGAKISKHENSESPSTLTVYYYELKIAGIVIVEKDVFAGIYRVNGVDQLAQFNANQGS